MVFFISEAYWNAFSTTDSKQFSKQLKSLLLHEIHIGGPKAFFDVALWKWYIMSNNFEFGAILFSDNGMTDLLLSY